MSNCIDTTKTNKKNKCHKKKNMCVNRNYRDKNEELAARMMYVKKILYGEPVHPVLENENEKKYQKYNYNGSFHKGLAHNLRDGRLESTQEYEEMIEAINTDDQKKLENCELAKDAQVKMVNPLSSLCTILSGATQGVMKLKVCPWLFSDTGAAEMVELYSKALARDVPFIEYETNPLISHLLGNRYMNQFEVLEYLEDSPSSISKPFTPKTIFRGNTHGDLYGPYISQLLLLNYVAGGLNIPQKYATPPTKVEAISEHIRVEWGINLEETINLQNCNLNLLPPQTPSNKFTHKYVHSGRSLAEMVHNDAAYQFYYQASLVLSALGVRANPGWPVYKNQSNFITCGGPVSLLCSLAEITECALKHGWYWKWQHYRKLRPEAFGLWTHDVKSGLVPNKDNFDISNVLLNNDVLNDIFNANNEWDSNANSYTLPLAFREGSPCHPSYIAGHAILSGACATVLKIHIDGEQKWNTLPGVISGAMSGIPNAVVQANSDGSSLVTYDGYTSNMTVGSEINKLASNVAFGRNWAGIHYRTDGTQGMILGESIAIRCMEDMLSTMVENNTNGTIPEITFRKFDGNLYTIKPTTCLLKN